MDTEIRWLQRFKSLNEAFAQLKKACEREDLDYLEIAGLIKHYELTFELCWKTMKDKLMFEGYNVTSPRQVIRKAYEQKYLANVDVWFDALEERNKLVHIYDKGMALQAVALIKEKFYPMLRACLDILNGLENDGLTENYRNKIRAVFTEVPNVQRAVLFGSRVMGTYHHASDIDFALEGEHLNTSDLGTLAKKFDESRLPVEVDLLIRANITNPDLEKQIEKYGIEFYRKEEFSFQYEK
jgi:nucleotidyltransferase substrate binding protein (TIGR01987 family)